MIAQVARYEEDLLAVSLRASLRAFNLPVNEMAKHFVEAESVGLVARRV